MGMASTRTTFTLDDQLAAQAKALKINVSAAARDGVTTAVREALAASDRAAYEANPEHPDPFWDAVQAWSDDDPR